MEMGEHSRYVKSEDRIEVVEDETRIPKEDSIIPLERCAWCFSLRGVAISSITVMVVVAILVFVLDFTVLEVHRSKKIEYETKKFEMFQDGGRFEAEPTFQNTFYLKTIYLNQVEANVSVLYEFMTSTGYSLEVIRLRNLKLIGTLPNKYKEHGLSRYALKEFVFESNEPIGPTANFQLDDCDECIVEGVNSSFAAIQKLRCLPSLLFHLKSAEVIWLGIHPSDPMIMDGNITLNIYGRSLLRVIHSDSREDYDVTSMISDCEPIIGWYRFKNVKKLAISGCTLSSYTLGTIIRNTKLTHLTLDRVNLTGFSAGGRMSQLFPSSSNLEQLTIKMHPFKTNGILQRSLLTSPQYTVLMTDFPSSLQTLILSGVFILSPLIDPVRTYLILDILRLSDINFQSQRALDSFQNGIDFKKLAFRQIQIQKGNQTGNILEDSTIWIPFLNKAMEKANWIWLENPFYRPYTFWYRNRANLKATIDDELRPWKAWLRRRGIDDLLLHDDPAFKLIKSEGQGSWEMETSHDGSPPETPNAALWFHFLRMGTFLRENLWNIIDW